MTELVPAHMIPKVIVVSDRIPFTVNGKIDRKAVARQLAEAELPAAQAFRPASTPLESALVAIVGEVLGVAAESIGIDDDFFSLGGDSVMATQVVARARDWLDTPTVLVTDMFAARCVSKLAERLVGREPDADRLDDGRRGVPRDRRDGPRRRAFRARRRLAQGGGQPSPLLAGESPSGPR